MRNSGLVADPACVGVPHIEYENIRLHTSYFFGYTNGVVFVILAAAAVKPKVVYLAVVGEKLAYLIYEVVVILAAVHLFIAELRRGVIQTDFYVILSASVREILYDVALAVSPRCVFNGVVGILRGPVCEAVMMLAHKNGILCAALFDGFYPLLAVKLGRVKLIEGHFFHIPVSVTLVEGSYSEVEKHAHFPVQKVELFFSDISHDVNFLSHR